MATFVSTDQCLSDLADSLQKTLADLAPQWNGIVSRSHAWAYNFIVATLTAKGFTLAQIVQWDQGGDFERDLTLWKALSRGGALSGFDDKFIKTYDVRQDLVCLNSLPISGVWQTPASTPGLVGTGALNTTEDIFVWPGDDGEGETLGQLLQW